MKMQDYYNITIQDVGLRYPSALGNFTTASLYTPNIMAQTIDGDSDNCVMLGSHTDSVPAGPGIEDNGSGMLALLEIATQLIKYGVKNCVQFGWFTAEEEGLHGSRQYVESLSEEENLKIRLFMDYDMLASPNYNYLVYDGTDAVLPAGSQALRDMQVRYYTDHGLSCKLMEVNGRSDYVEFVKHGIPFGGVSSGGDEIKTAKDVEMFGGNLGQELDSCYHKSCDDIGNLNMTAWEVNTKVR